MALHYFLPCPSLFSSIFSSPFLILPLSLISSNDDQRREKGRKEERHKYEKKEERWKEREGGGNRRENCWKKAVTKSFSLLEKNLDCYFCTWRIWRSLHLFLTHHLLNASLSLFSFFFSLSSHSFALKVKMQSTSSSWTHLNVIYGQEFLLEKVFRSLFLSLSSFSEKDKEKERKK